MSSDSTGAAADLADALDDFAERSAATGALRDVWLTVGGPHALEQRTVQLPADVADWITELLRAGPADLTGDNGQGGQGDLGDTSAWPADPNGSARRPDRTPASVPGPHDHAAALANVTAAHGCTAARSSYWHALAALPVPTATAPPATCVAIPVCAGPGTGRAE